MRTTLSLDDDVAAQLERLCDRRKQSFKQTVNEVLRAGLGVLAARRKEPRPRYAITPVSLGQPSLPDLDNVSEVLAIAEGDDRR